MSNNRPARKLTDEQVLAMRAMWRSGANWAECAEAFGLHPTTAYRMGVGLSYKDVPLPITCAERVARDGPKDVIRRGVLTGSWPIHSARSLAP